jgi:hypothetical protein
MKASVWFRGVSGLFAFFALSHTIGFLKPPAGASPAAPVYDAMLRVHFPAMGFMRSYLDFYRGFGLSVSLEFIVMAMLAWQVASLTVRHPREAMPLAATLVVGSVGTAVISVAYFFAAPIVVSMVTVCVVLAGCTRLVLEARQPPLRRAA